MSKAMVPAERRCVICAQPFAPGKGAKGMCYRHYQQAYRGRVPEPTVIRRRGIVLRRIDLRLDPDAHDLLEQLAEANGQPVAGYARTMILRQLAVELARDVLPSTAGDSR